MEYKWTQSADSVTVTIPVGKEIKPRDVVVTIHQTSLVAGLKGQEPIIKVCIIRTRTREDSQAPAS